MWVHLHHFHLLLFMCIQIVFVEPNPVKNAENYESNVVLFHFLLDPIDQVSLHPCLCQILQVSLFLLQQSSLDVFWHQRLLFVRDDSWFVLDTESLVFLSVKFEQKLSRVEHRLLPVPWKEFWNSFGVLCQVRQTTQWQFPVWVLTDFNKLKQIKQPLRIEKPFFTAPTAQNRVPQTVQHTQPQQNVTIGRRDIFVLQVRNYNIDTMLFSEQLLVLLTVMAQIGQYCEAKLLDLNWVLFLVALKEVQQVIHHTFFCDF